MRKSNILLLTAIFLAAATIFVAYALPTITVNVQQAGEGQNTIVAPVSTVRVNLLFDASYTEVTAVEVIPAQSISAGAIIAVHVLDASSNISGFGTYSASAAITSGQVVTVPLNTPVANANVAGVDVVVVGPTS